MDEMKILIAMESSGIVRDEFIKKGHLAISCDFLDSERTGPHYKGDVYDILLENKWDLIIAFPTCTKLCVSGNHVYAYGKPKYHERLEAVKWTYKFWEDCKKQSVKVCFENPVGVLPTLSEMPKPHYVQPYNFGHDASKKTGLFLHGLPELEPTKYIEPRIVNGKMRWANQTDSGQNKLAPSKDRWKLRSKTYPGIARAMADKWG